jgi:hypothetical protein
MRVGSISRVDRSKLLGRRAQDPVRKRESQLRVVELKCAGSLAVLGGNHSCADDLDGFAARAMTSSHIVVESVNSSVKRYISILTIHIMSATS